MNSSRIASLISCKDNTTMRAHGWRHAYVSSANGIEISQGVKGGSLKQRELSIYTFCDGLGIHLASCDIMHGTYCRTHCSCLNGGGQPRLFPDEDHIIRITQNGHIQWPSPFLLIPQQVFMNVCVYNHSRISKVSRHPFKSMFPLTLKCRIHNTGHTSGAKFAVHAPLYSQRPHK
jgi:hypothetical protein